MSCLLLLLMLLLCVPATGRKGWLQAQVDKVSAYACGGVVEVCV